MSTLRRARPLLLALILPILTTGCVCHSRRPDRPKNTLGYWEEDGKGYRLFPVTDVLVIGAGHTPLVLFGIVTFPLDLVTWPLRHVIPCGGKDGRSACVWSGGRAPAAPRP